MTHKTIKGTTDSKFMVVMETRDGMLGWRPIEDEAGPGARRIRLQLAPDTPLDKFPVLASLGWRTPDDRGGARYSKVVHDTTEFGSAVYEAVAAMSTALLPLEYEVGRTFDYTDPVNTGKVVVDQADAARISCLLVGLLASIDPEKINEELYKQVAQAEAVLRGIGNGYEEDDADETEETGLED